MQVDSKEVQQIKSLIRSSEARSAARVCGCNIDNLHFLDMPFYETGDLYVKSQNSSHRHMHILVCCSNSETIAKLMSCKSETYVICCDLLSPGLSLVTPWVSEAENMFMTRCQYFMLYTI